MFDFVEVRAKRRSRGETSIYPEFFVKMSKDLMIRGGAFYAVWNEDTGFWDTNELYVAEKIDYEIREFIRRQPDDGKGYDISWMSSFSSQSWMNWKKYCKNTPDSYAELDKKIMFDNEEVKKSDYVTRKVDYPLGGPSMQAYERLMSTLYDEEERRKIEWSIGAILTGDSRKIQKFLVLYGGPGTGKSTAINIIQSLIPGYYSMFDSKALGNANASFALEPFKDNPLVAIQHDGDLSRLDDNTRLNSIVSHEKMVINEKFKALYNAEITSFIIMGTNKPVRITDLKSGLLRRLIDVTPSGRRLDASEYDQVVNMIGFERGAIAKHCIDVYHQYGMHYYDAYIPNVMMSETNDMYNFIEDNYEFFTKDHPDYVTLGMTWLKYKEYCQDANIQYPLQRRQFGTELKSYFKDFYERWGGERSVYIGFREDRFQTQVLQVDEKNDVEGWLMMDSHYSILDAILEECPAQYAKDGIPAVRWDECQTTLHDIDTSVEHYVRPPEEMIVIDFDLKDADGNKDARRNLEEASKWPQTYAEFSKSGAGIHLHYWWSGDPSQLASLVKKDVEIKVFTGKSALRRRLSKCNTLDVAFLNTGLPLKEEKKMLNEENVKSEKALRALIVRNLRKEIHAGTKPSIDFIKKILDDAYASDLKYDVTDMRGDIQQFAMRSSNHPEYCLKMVGQMKFKSEEASENVETRGDDVPIIIFDVEVFPNLFLVCWKKKGPGNEVVRMYNPKPSEIEDLMKYRLVGFNCRNYDNHILYGRMMGYTNQQLFELSKQIISEEGFGGKFSEAYNISYTDVYDFLSAGNKMSLKKWEIKLGIPHKEFPYPWDKPLPEDKWEECGDYCCNDVLATEATWDANEGDWVAREILSKLSGLTVNDTTNHHTIQIITGGDKNPQDQFIYTDLSTIFPGYEYNEFGIDKSRYKEGTKIVSGRSIYMGEDPGEGGHAVGYPGYYEWVALMDVAGMHPSSIEALKLFGEKYTKRYGDLKRSRNAIKHNDFHSLETLLDGQLMEFVKDGKVPNGLSDALKTALNSAYGLTSASFPNKLRDPRNVDNIVAKYGALFMITLKHELWKRGCTVVHIKTDSVKIANATMDDLKFVYDFGQKYGFEFEHEATYEKMCIVNDAVYIARYASNADCMDMYGHIPSKQHEGEWTATGTQFQIPYVFKTLFSGDPLVFKDYCNTFSVKTALYLDMNEGLSELPFDEDGNPTPDDHPSRHNYKFIGKVGSFVPVVEGAGGGILLREGQNKDGSIKYDAATGSKGYRWMEDEMASTFSDDIIDIRYFENLAQEAKNAIGQYIPFEEFLYKKVDRREEIPFDEYMNTPDLGIPLVK